MNNDQSSSQGKLLLENSMPILHEDEEKMIKEASSIADMMKSPEMKFFRKLPKKIPEEIITIEDSDEDPIVIKDSDEENEDRMHEETSNKTENSNSVIQEKGVDHFEKNSSNQGSEKRQSRKDSMYIVHSFCDMHFGFLVYK